MRIRLRENKSKPKDLYKSYYDIVINGKVEGKLYSYDDVIWTFIYPRFCIDEEKYGKFDWVKEDVENYIEVLLLNEKCEEIITKAEEKISKIS